MRYRASAFAAVSRPNIITVGRASSRPGWQWAWWRALTRWWVRTVWTWEPRPISTEQMLRLQGSAGDPLLWFAEMATILRATFPRRWWHQLHADPVKTLLLLPDGLRSRTLGTLVRLPKSVTDQSRVIDDPIEVVRQAQREAVHGKGASSDSPTLAIVALTVRHALGDTWYYNPARWTTSDGYAPFAVTWLEFVGIQALGAQKRLEVADGMALLHANNPRAARQKLQRDAFPSEVH